MNIRLQFAPDISILIPQSIITRVIALTNEQLNYFLFDNRAAFIFAHKQCQMNLHLPVHLTILRF